MKQFNRKKILILSAAATAIVLLLFVFSKCTHTNYKDEPFTKKQNFNKIRTPKVETAKAKIGKIEIFTHCVGNLKPNSQVVIKSEIEGIVKQIHFEDGGEIDKNQILFSLDDSLAVAKYKEIVARLSHAKAEFERASGLHSKKYISESEVFKREAEMKSLMAQAEVAKIELKKYKIYSPINGKAGLREIFVGDYLQRGSQLISIVNDTPLQIEFKIPELQLLNVKVGQTVIITTENNPVEYYGTIKALSPVSEKSSHMVLARAVLDDHDGNILPGQFANAKIITEHTEQATLIQETAIMHTNGEDFVYRVLDGIALRTNIVIGAYQQNGEVQVLSGIFPGDNIIVKGHIRVQDGQPVKIINKNDIFKGANILNQAPISKPSIPANTSVTSEQPKK